MYNYAYQMSINEFEWILSNFWMRLNDIKWHVKSCQCQMSYSDSPICNCMCRMRTAIKYSTGFDSCETQTLRIPLNSCIQTTEAFNVFNVCSMYVQCVSINPIITIKFYLIYNTIIVDLRRSLFQLKANIYIY